MTSTLLVTTTPREIEPRWVHAGDQIAVMATHYDPAHAVTLVRTTDLAKVSDLVSWWYVVRNPEHPDAADTKSGPFPPVPLSGFRLTIAPYPSEADVWPDPVELLTGEHEQIVIREMVTVEPWELECRGLEGTCYLPAGHPGPCDPDRDVQVTTERQPQ